MLQLTDLADKGYRVTLTRGAAPVLQEDDWVLYVGPPVYFVNVSGVGGVSCVFMVDPLEPALLAGGESAASHWDLAIRHALSELESLSAGVP